MVSVGIFVPLFAHPDSAVANAIGSPLAQRGLIGLAMGLTAIGLIYSPWGGRSGAHMNPAVTLTFLRLGKIKPFDAAGYIVAQFIGGYLGVVLIAQVVGSWFTTDPIDYAPTLPATDDVAGVGIAFAAEGVLTFVMMMMVLITSNRSALARSTGILSGVLLLLYITFESPLSGMSINPARTVVSALPAGRFDALWVYLVAPPLGMLLAAEVYGRLRNFPKPGCCKLNHHTPGRCIHCGVNGPLQLDQPMETSP